MIKITQMFAIQSYLNKSKNNRLKIWKSYLEEILFSQNIQTDDFVDWN